MTIRDKLKAQMFKVRIAIFAFWLLFVAGMVLHVGGANQPFALIPFLGFAGAILYSMFFIKCPKCDAPLGQVLNKLRKFNFCPVCGVSLDSPTQF